MQEDNKWPNRASEVLGRSVRYSDELGQADALALLSAYFDAEREEMRKELGREPTEDEWARAEVQLFPQQAARTEMVGSQLYTLSNMEEFFGLELRVPDPTENDEDE